MKYRVLIQLVLPILRTEKRKDGLKGFSIPDGQQLFMELKLNDIVDNDLQSHLDTIRKGQMSLETLEITLTGPSWIGATTFPHVRGSSNFLTSFVRARSGVVLLSNLLFILSPFAAGRMFVKTLVWVVVVGCPVGTFAEPNDLVTGNFVVDVASCSVFVKELGRIELLMLKLPKLTSVLVVL